MFKKLFVIFLIFVLLLSAEAALAEKEEYDFTKMTTYEMFWPIVAGKIPGDRFYSLKLWRDKLIGYLFFSKLKRSEFLKQQANKRLVEAERLLEIERYSYLPEILKLSSENFKQGLNLLFSAPESNFQFWLKEEYAKDLQKHLIVLQRMKKKAKEDQKAVLENSTEYVKKLAEEHKIEISE